VADVLQRPLAGHPHAEALVGRHARFTFDALEREVGRAAGALASLGIEPGDRVAASLPNHPEIVVAFLATMRLGAVWVGVNRPLAPPEKAYLLRDAEVGLLLADREVAEQPLRVDGLRILRVDPTAPDDEWRACLEAADPAPRVDIDPFAPAAIAYTSGTTGFPKGAVHSQHNLLLPGAVARANASYDPVLRQGVCLPLTVLNLMVLAPLVTLQLGSCCVCMDRTDPLGMAEWIHDERIGTFSAVPAMVHGLLTHPEITDAHLASLVRPGVGGADLPESFRTLYRERFGAEVTVGYGLTEAPTAVTTSDPKAVPVPNSAGRALPQVRIEIRDAEGAAVPVGSEGEICVGPATEGPWSGVYTPFLGYWNQPDATAVALRDGILHTGDVGRLDAAGNLFVLDRRNDLILRGGANIYPAEVERVLHVDPRVAACAVVGRPDERLGERVVAFVQLAEGAAATEAELRAHCEKELARYKVPEEWRFIDEFDRTPMGKIRKTVLREAL
jgi:long-chain acyl-CoA synthetase